ncbi:MAG: ComEC/Rec2 family competence protein, partial [Endomicrobiia bacterium]|nr:ComEC/Rec2 family competence protein [Endomicrobiia bacterium]
MSDKNDPPHIKIYRAFRARPFFWAAVVQIIFIAAKGLERIVPPSPAPPPYSSYSATSTAAKNLTTTDLSKKSASSAHNPTSPNTGHPDLTELNLIETEGVIADWPQTRRGTLRFALKTPTGEKIAVFADPDVPSGTAAPSPLAKGLIVRLRGRFRAPRRARNPGEFDYSGYLLTRGIRRTFRAREVSIAAPAGALDRLSAAVRAATIRAVGKYVPGRDEASLLLRMLIGSSEVEAGNEESEERFAVLRENFAIAGVAHVLVISGLHVGYVAAIFWFIFRLGGVSKKTAGALALPFIWLYAAAAGGTTPVVRAAAMATSLIISATAGRGYDSYQAIGLASVITLSLNPSDLFSPGFQLSYAATFGIIHFSKYARSLFGGMNRVAAWTLGILWMSFSAQLFTTPIVSHYFGRFSTVAFIANLIVVPAAGASLAAGLAALMLDLIFEPAASVAGYAAALALGASSHAVDFLSKLPRASVPVVG